VTVIVRILYLFKMKNLHRNQTQQYHLVAPVKQGEDLLGSEWVGKANDPLDNEELENNT
jgi:hypothetical protein